MKAGLILSVAIASALPTFAKAQNSPAPAPAPAAVTSQEMASPAMQFRALPAVLDARGRRLDWHKAAQQAADRITDPALKAQFTERLSGLVPQITKMLMADSQQEAVVSVAVYVDPKTPGKEAMLALTFDGLGSTLGGNFYADVLAGQPKAPQFKGAPKSLEFDSAHSSYLVFFMGIHQLEAGDISQAEMGKTILTAANRARERESSPTAPLAANPNSQNAAAQQRAQQQQANDQAQAEQAQLAAAQESGSDQTQIIPEYVTPANNTVYGYGGGYYYPGVGVPLVILPGEYPESPAYQKQQRDREHELEQAYRPQRPNGMSIPGQPRPVTNATPGSAPQNGSGPAVPVATPTSPPVAHPTSPPVAAPTSPPVAHETPAPAQRPSAPAAAPAPAAPAPAPAAHPAAPAAPEKK